MRDMGWHPHQGTLGSTKKVHWLVRDECKLGLVHRWQAVPRTHKRMKSGSPFPSGRAVCACNSLAVECPEAAGLWDCSMNGDLTPGDVAKTVSQSRGLEGSSWQTVAPKDC